MGLSPLKLLLLDGLRKANAWSAGGGRPEGFRNSFLWCQPRYASLYRFLTNVTRL
jgi:hypothetical protein